MTATITARGAGERHTGQTVEIAELSQWEEVSPSFEGTALQLPGLPNAVLRNVLESWEETLSPNVPMLMMNLNAVASQVSEFRLRFARLTGRKIAWVGPSTESSLAEVDAEADFESADDSGEDTAVSAVYRLRVILGLPVRDVLAAAGVAHRTFYSWRGSNVEPRLASQGRLWDLLQTSIDLQEMLGGDLPRWIAADPDRRQNLLAGNFDSLVGEVLEQRARRGDYTAGPHVAEWVGGAGPEEFITPPPSRRLTGKVSKANSGARIRKNARPVN